MAKIITYDNESNPLDLVSVFIFDSTGKKIGGLITNSKGEGNIKDELLTDKNGRIEFSRVGYEPSKVKISDFEGRAYLKMKEQTLGNVEIRRKIQKPFQIKNPFEAKKEEVVVAKKKPKVALAVGGGLALGLLALLSIKNLK